MNWQEFFSMGDHGLYVWWSYGLTLLTILLLLLLFNVYRRKLLVKIKMQQQEQSLKARVVKTENVSG